MAASGGRSMVLLLGDFIKKYKSIIRIPEAMKIEVSKYRL